jgi:hypothetical protein
MVNKTIILLVCGIFDFSKGTQGPHLAKKTIYVHRN